MRSRAGFHHSNHRASVLRAWRWLAACALVLLAGWLLPQGIPPSHAAQESYDYDALGRLVRVVDEQGRVTVYTFDAASNILTVATGGSASGQGPSISSIAPGSIRRGETKAFSLTGQRLNFGELSTSDPGLDLLNVQRTAVSMSFSVIAADNTPLGVQTILLTSAVGTAGANITVNPKLPVLTVEPAPLAVPPDSVSRAFTLRLSNADTINHVIAISSANPAVATVSPASVTIPAGQTTALANLTGIAAGSVTLNFTSSTLAPASVPVFVTAEFRGLSTSFSKPLGVLVEAAPNQNSTAIGPVVARNLGVAVGGFVGSVSPRSLPAGTANATLTISGAGFAPGAVVTLTPGTGITVGAAVVAGSGNSLTVPVSVDANAAFDLRKVQVLSSGAALPAANPEAMTVLITRAAAEIISIEPFFATAGQTLTLKIRGRNLQDASGITLAPATGITSEAGASVNADGTELLTRIQLGLTTAAGDKIVVVNTPAGPSSAIAAAANTFRVVNSIGDVLTPIASPLLGVMVGGAGAATISNAVFNPPLGVVVGAAATTTSPKVGIIGQQVTLVINGIALDAVTGVVLTPATGVAVGAVTVASGGTSVSVPLTIDANAPQTLRGIKLMAGSEMVPFVDPAEAQFLVSAPPPVLISVAPNYLAAGAAAATVTVRGTNLQGATAVRLEPAAGITVFNPPVVNGAGDVLTVSMTAAAGAASGPRALVVTTSGGDSALALAPQNTVTISSNVGPTITPVIAADVGVVVGEATPPVTDTSLILAAALGVVVQIDPVTSASKVQANDVGVVVGAIATSFNSAGFIPGASGNLLVGGVNLPADTQASVIPATDITVGTPAVAGGGGSISVPVSVGSGAQAGERWVRLYSSGQEILFTQPGVNRFAIGVGIPSFASIAPILGKQGDTLTLTIRGSNLSSATAVIATPAGGITFVNPPVWTTDTFGEKLTVTFLIDATAPLGGRVIQVVSPGALSDGNAAPANTLTVIAP